MILKTMTITLQRIKPHLLSPGTSERELASLLEGIKGTYTFNRADLEQKRWSEKEVSAYASFYLPTNYQKFSMLMSQLPSEIRSQLGVCEVIDFGTGPGTYLLAFMDYFGSDHCAGLVGVDKDQVMLSQARKLLSGTYPNVGSKLKLSSSIPANELDQPRLLIFGNSLNELSTEQVKEVIIEVEPQFLLFIEPGTPAVFDSMINIREWLASREFACFYPCPSIKLSCPVAQRVSEGRDDWCHQVWRGTHEEGIERLGQLAKIDRKVMPFIGHFYGASVVHAQSENVRFMRFLSETKHSFEWEVCLLKEEGLRLLTFEIPKKSFSKKEQKLMKKISVGENFSFELIRKISDERWRVSVSLIK